MTLREESVRGITVLEVDGRIDSGTAPVLDERLSTLFTGPGHRLVLDLGRVEYISSAGFRVLLLAGRHATREGGQLVLCAMSAKVRQLFEITDFLDLFTVCGSRTDGLAALA